MRVIRPLAQLNRLQRYYRVPRTVRAGLLTLLTGICLCASAARCLAADPETEVSKVLGQSLSQAYAAQYGTVDDPLVTQWVQRMGSSLAAQSPRQNLPYHFGILDTAEINAFALPGGYVFVTRGLLDYLQSQDELAGVMGHEVEHVTARHPMRTIEFQLGATLAAAYGPLPHSELATTLEEGAILLTTLQFSREHESQADRYGIRFATEAGYDPDGLVQFLKSLGIERHPGFLAHYLATHPTNANRIKALESTPYLNPGDGPLQETIGDRLMASCRPAVALPHFRNALKASPGNPQIQAKIAAAEALLGPAPSAAAAPTAAPAPPTATPSVGPVTSPPGASVPLSQPAAQAALQAASQDLDGRVKRVTSVLRRVQGLATLDATLRDALLATTTYRLGDVRWLALAIEAYVETDRLDDVYARLAEADRTLLAVVAAMSREVAAYPPQGPRSQELWASAIRLANETCAAGRDMDDGVGSLERSDVLMAGVLGDLDSVLLGFRAQVNNIRFAAVEAALIAAAAEINRGRRLGGEALSSLARAEDRLLVAAIDRLGEAAGPERLALFDCGTAHLLGLDEARVREARQTTGYGEAVIALALSEELGKSIGEVRDRYDRMKALYAATFSQSPPKIPLPGWVDAAVDQSGSPPNLEIMLRQVEIALREESAAP